MPHIHTEPGQHDHTISIYLIRIDFDEPKVLLHFHHKMKAFAQFGGHIELDETPWQAAIHELKEESGYSIDQLQLLQPAKRLQAIAWATVHPVPVAHATMGYPSYGGHFHTDTVYAFTANKEPENTPEDGESTDLRLFNRDEIASSAEIDTITRDISLYILDEIIKDWQPIPAIDFK